MPAAGAGVRLGGSSIMSSYAQPSGLRSSRKWLLNTLLATASVSAERPIRPLDQALDGWSEPTSPRVT